MSDRGWIGVDLDGTLAHYDGWKGAAHIGEPIPRMIALVRQWLAAGKEVRVFTARVSCEEPELAQTIKLIGDWTVEHIGRRLPITNRKDYGMLFCVDDRAKQVVPNTGILLEEAIDHIPGAMTFLNRIGS